ncbi:hypothetical protein NP233_g5561 [Leucocoprinus birnbaumii]|uniref:Uncharacterized protein n=1 Tax=Leucocoprinus birnbaumii TaxID=56174 RepID=A0AAD5YWL7_9AGAR|nr:hypothetical protein NP233_g5561 [Leucocoprinus birnbaumii]
MSTTTTLTRNIGATSSSANAHASTFNNTHASTSTSTSNAASTSSSATSHADSSSSSFVINLPPETMNLKLQNFVTDLTMNGK